jgi:seryl-tRNA synthetase
MSDIAEYDIKTQLRKERLNKLKETKKERIKTLSKAVKKRGVENSEVLTDLLQKTRDDLYKEKDEIFQVISHLQYLMKTLQDFPEDKKNVDIQLINNEIYQLSKASKLL